MSCFGYLGWSILHICILNHTGAVQLFARVPYAWVPPPSVIRQFLVCVLPADTTEQLVLRSWPGLRIPHGFVGCNGDQMCALMHSFCSRQLVWGLVGLA